MLKAVSGAAAALCLSACASAPLASPEPAAFQVRTDFDAPLNAADGFAGAPGETVIVDADAPFRLRMAAPARASGPLLLQVRRNGGAWEPVEAHGFPLPERELEIDYAEQSPGAAPEGWRIAAPSSAALAIVETGTGPALSVTSRGAEAVALFQPPWPLEAFSFAAAFDAPENGALSLVFGFESLTDHARAEIDADAGEVRLVRIENGARRVLIEAPFEAGPGERILAEIQGEDGMLELNVNDGAMVIEHARPAGLGAEALGLHLTGARALVHAVAVAGEASTPRVSLVESDGYGHGEPTTPLLSGSGGAPGYAVSLKDRTPDLAGGAPADIVWPLVIRRFADGAVTNEAGDRFEFRMAGASGAPVSRAPYAEVRLAVPEGHLGGTFVETPGRIGPWRTADGALYFIMEPAETDNLFMVVRSTDGGASWEEVDGANRPATGDLEAVDARRVGDTLVILHQITEQVLLHTFNLAGHPTRPDQWAETDALVAEVEAVSQMATLAARPDGSLVAVFLGDRLYFAERPAGAAWSAMRPLDSGAEAMTVGPQAIAAPDGAVHIAYADVDGDVWLRTLSPGGALSPRLKLASGAVTGEDDYGAVLPLVWLEQSETLVVAYRLADASLWERRLSRGALSTPVQITPGPVITNAVDAQQPAADIVAHGGHLHVLFVDEATRAIYAMHDCGEGWSAPALQAGDINGSWVRGAVFPGSEGAPVYGYVYDAGSDGGAGLNRYDELALTVCR